jgi:hypothetical protein
MANLTWIFILLDNIAAVIGQFGLILMKLAFVEQEGIKNSKNGFLRCKWWLGFMLEVVNSLLHVVDEAFVPLVVLSASGATAIVAGVMLSIFWLKEMFIWQYDVTAIVLILLGCAGIIASANKQPDNYTFEELLALIKQA